MKKCTKCLEEKPFSEYQVRKFKSGKTGYYPACRPCRRQRYRDFYKKNSEKVIAKQKEYLKDPEVKKRREVYKRQWNKEYESRPDILKKRRERRKERYHSSGLQRKKDLCRGQTQNLIKKGVIKRLEHCEYPDCRYTDRRIEIHHWDYDNPLDIRFLCTKHHNLADKIRKLIEIQKL